MILLNFPRFSNEFSILTILLEGSALSLDHLPAPSTRARHRCHSWLAVYMRRIESERIFAAAELSPRSTRVTSLDQSCEKGRERYSTVQFQETFRFCIANWMTSIESATQ
jgi:hypothetical protein